MPQARADVLLALQANPALLSDIATLRTAEFQRQRRASPRGRIAGRTIKRPANGYFGRPVI